MPGSNDPSRIYRDPALTDRRGDATGPVALLFLALVVAAFAVVAVVLVSLPPVVADPTPRPAVAASVAPAATPPPTQAPEPTREPDPVDEPTDDPLDEPTDEPIDEPTEEPVDEPRSSGSPVRTRTGDFGESIPVILDGKRIGTVRLDAFKSGTIPGLALPDGAKLLVMTVTYTASATTPMPYHGSDWVIEDPDGGRYESLGDQAPDPALGRGRLAPGESVTGKVAFIRPAGVAEMAWIALVDRDGNELVRVDRTTAP